MLESRSWIGAAAYIRLNQSDRVGLVQTLIGYLRPSLHFYEWMAPFRIPRRTTWPTTLCANMI